MNLTCVHQQCKKKNCYSWTFHDETLCCINIILPNTGGPPRGNTAQRGPNRGNQRGQSSRGRYQSNRKVESPLKFEGEFDFEEANAQFDKDEIERELKEKLTIGETSKVHF